MSSVKRKAPETLLQRRVRPRRESSAELEDQNEDPVEETEEEDEEGHSAEDGDSAEEVRLTKSSILVPS
jgi:hypothetical protein